MEKLIEELIRDYDYERITWKDVQDYVEVFLIQNAGGIKEYEKIPIRERGKKETEILRKIESKIYQHD